MVSELEPRYYEQVYRGNVFFAASQASTTFSANGLTSSSAVGLCIYNPPSNTKNLIPIQVEVLLNLLVTSSTNVQVVGVVSSAFSSAVPTSAGGLTVYSAAGVGRFASAAIAAQSLTFAANPVIWKNFYSAFCTTTIAATTPTPSVAVYDVGGSIIIPPGTGMALVGNNASNAFASVTWMELAV
jgi:hypothetical protein